MEIVSRAAAAAVVGSILALLVKKHAPEHAAALGLVTLCVIVWMSSSVASEIADAFRTLTEKGNVSSIYVSPVMKCIGIGLVTSFSAQLCRDAQQGSIAVALELCGTLCALFVSLPLIRALLTTVEKLV